MDTYGTLRAFADSWGVLALVIFFVAMVAWLWRPGARRLHDDAASQIFRNEDRPKDPSDDQAH